jgi:hypothetical protein
LPGNLDGAINLASITPARKEKKVAREATFRVRRSGLRAFPNSIMDFYAAGPFSCYL